MKRQHLSCQKYLDTCEILRIVGGISTVDMPCAKDSRYCDIALSFAPNSMLHSEQTFIRHSGVSHERI